mmetsp:Transcript_36033/g.102597  ORF Transcript_36033/g.102597 Transcript_36033/m.102597 type:complete len:304 (+) Transcript_36033:2148-3059(+)
MDSKVHRALLLAVELGAGRFHPRRALPRRLTLRAEQRVLHQHLAPARAALQRPAGVGKHARRHMLQGVVQRPHLEHVGEPQETGPVAGPGADRRVHPQHRHVRALPSHLQVPRPPGLPGLRPGAAHRPADVGADVPQGRGHRPLRAAVGHARDVGAAHHPGVPRPGRRGETPRPPRVGALRPQRVLGLGQLAARLHPLRVPAPLRGAGRLRQVGAQTAAGGERGAALSGSRVRDVRRRGERPARELDHPPPRGAPERENRQRGAAALDHVAPRERHTVDGGRRHGQPHLGGVGRGPTTSGAAS